MTRQARPKIVFLQDVPVCVGAALSAHMQAQADITIITTATDLPDLIICAAITEGLPAAIPILRLVPPDRLGALLADMRRALDEPALAVAPFFIGTTLFNPAAKTLTPPTGIDITLTERETALLLYLARHAPAPVSREALLRAVWHYQDGIDTHTLETHIYRLRQKITPEGGEPLLHTLDDGYALAAVTARQDF